MHSFAGILNVPIIKGQTSKIRKEIMIFLNNIKTTLIIFWMCSRRNWSLSNKFDFLTLICFYLIPSSTCLSTSYASPFSLNIAILAFVELATQDGRNKWSCACKSTVVCFSFLSFYITSSFWHSCKLYFRRHRWHLGSVWNTTKRRSFNWLSK